MQPAADGNHLVSKYFWISMTQTISIMTPIHRLRRDQLTARSHDKEITLNISLSYESNKLPFGAPYTIFLNISVQSL